MTIRTLILTAVMCLPLAACNSSEDTAQGSPDSLTVSGTVTYREKIALSPEATLEISLLDVSRQDVRARLISRQRITNPGQVPIAFTLEVDPADIDENMSYSVRAQISERRKLLFVSDTAVPVLTRGAGNEVEIVLISVKPPGFGLPTGSASATPSNQSHSQGMELEGMFRYMADAASFRDCRNGKRYPVSMEGDYIELERAYLNSGIQAGSEALVTLEGRLLERPADDGNHNVVKLIVDKLNHLDVETSCVPEVHADLGNTYWKLIELDGRKVLPPEDRKEAHLILQTAEARISGNSGCNKFFGRYETKDDTLSFFAIGTTMMACPDGMETEQAFMTALAATQRYTISGLFLTLFAEDAPLARLEAVYL